MADNEATGGRPLRFGVVAPIGTDLPAWRDQVRRIADSGYSTLLMPDVPRWPAPGPALAVAATLADLRVGTWVYASPLWTPWTMAWEAHSLSVLTEGREQNMRPWVEDHRRMDDSLARRWDGEDIDLTDRLPSDLIMAAASQDPSIAPSSRLRWSSTDAAVSP